MTIKRTENITCDGDKCEHVRDQDSNHWLVGMSLDKSIIVAASRTDLRVGDQNGIKLHQLDNVKDFCGEACAIKWVSKMLTKIKK